MIDMASEALSRTKHVCFLKWG